MEDSPKSLMGALYQMGVLNQPLPLAEPQGLMGALYANPLLMRQVANQRASNPRPDVTDLFGYGPSWQTYAQNFQQNLAQNYPIDSAENVRNAAFNAALGAGPLMTIFKGGNIPRGAKWLSKDEMLKRGADGHLSRAMEAEIPVAKVSGREPTPAMEGGYVKGRKITQPIEVVYQPANDTFILYSGNHRITQAELNGDELIKAFVEIER